MIMANHHFNVSDDLDDRTFQLMHVPCLKDDSMAGPHAFVKIIHLYLRTADIWICWFGRFAFVKPSRLHLRLEHRWISPKTICVFSNCNNLHL